MKRLIILTIAGSQLVACAPFVDIVKPEVPVPANWSPEYPWRQGKPSDDASKGAWWTLFGDVELDRLEHLALSQNPGLQIAAARLEQAKAQASVASAGLYPQLNLAASAERYRTSENRPKASPTSQPISISQNDFTLGLAVRYEADFSGRVRSGVHAAEASVEQAKADVENARLLLSAELASDYYALCELDAELEVVRESIALQRKALDFVSTRHDLGAATGLDLAQQQAQVDATITQVDMLERQRSQLEHAIATLTGTPAPGFKIGPRPLADKPPDIPVQLPSDILQRRPDVASAERAMAAANAQIGVARAAFYPSVILSPMAGLESATLSSLLNASSLMWSFGISAVQTLFDAGRNHSNLDFAQVGYRGAVESYRQTVLTAMQEVQDGLSGISILGRAAGNTANAVQSSIRVLELARARYEGGIGTHLDVITAQQSLLSSQRQAVQVAGQQFQISVFLVKAVGGSW